jgi:hypothetical protein
MAAFLRVRFYRAEPVHVRFAVQADARAAEQCVATA